MIIGVFLNRLISFGPKSDKSHLTPISLLGEWRMRGQISLFPCSVERAPPRTANFQFPLIQIQR